MNSLVTALNSMEHRLQSFIEGSLAKIFPQAAGQKSFARHLVQALPEYVRQDERGRYTAPHTITLIAAPSVSDYLRNHPGLLEEISEQIEIAAFEAEIFFEEPPHLQVKSNPELQSNDLQFEFAQESSRPGTTAILPTSPGARQPTFPQNAYLIVEGKDLYTLNQSVTNLGRRDDNHIVINDRRVSRQHAQIRHMRGKFTIFDLQSSGGTFVNHKRIHHSPLRPGDVISLAGVLIVFGNELHDQLTKTQDHRPDQANNLP